MWLAHTTYIGVLPLADRPLSYAALDADLSLLALSEGPLAEVLAFCGGQKQAVVAIAAPLGPSQGLLQSEAYRQTLPTTLRAGRWQQGRVAEYLLRRHNLRMLPTPADPQQAPSWVQLGFRLYRRLQAMGYQPYPAEQAAHQVLETYPHAAFAALLGHLPFPKHTLEGRIQRQLVLQEQGLDLPDPLRVLEEFTRHRLLRGLLPTEGLLSPTALDALVAAFTAYRAATAPQEVASVGDPAEGQIFLPVPQLKARYARTR